ncbi:alpha/beta hydrolase [Tsuneonella sp. CC-YZS046]|uniref:alpha/beta hydrolase n=1 Tax=Tsuneonella sp. CC-YZS046 TaxID=3042152 RepID=UPI002D76A04F|nr:alpha/beta hydrolase [Tsuneonella sp. CC-YZS046]WRO66900.1 alpha/beta hydrolase [Tsuneonella sp. CC-YZS046]
MEGHWVAADGQAIRRIDWPAGEGAAKGSLLFLPGRGDAYEKYLETLDHWASRGWRVTSLDWRGQAGSGRLGRDPVTGHIDDFATWVADLRSFWESWSAQGPGPCILAGHSMGGHLALRAVAERAVNPDALILIAPMLGIASQRLPMGLLHGVARLMAALGDPRRPAWRWSEKPGQVPEGRIDLLTHDSERYADELWWRDARPELAMGPGSWGWVERAYASMRGLARDGVLETVKIPVLILATQVDRLVDTGAIKRAAHRLPDCELVLFGEEARHEILREGDPARDRALDAIDQFLEKAAFAARSPA